MKSFVFLGAAPAAGEGQTARQKIVWLCDARAYLAGTWASQLLGSAAVQEFSARGPARSQERRIA